MLASCSGALLTSLFVTPLDVVKIRLQAQKSPFPKGKCFVYYNGLMDHTCVCTNGNSKAWYKAPGHFNGTLDAFIKIVRREGIKSLWSGLPPTLIMAVPATVIYFTCYDQLRAALRVRMGSHAEEALLLAGALTRAMYWYNYEKGKAWLCKHNNIREPTFAITFISGAVSGSIASIVTLPFDVVKTRRQVEIGELQAMNLSSKASSSTLSVMTKIVAENGVGGLFVGFLPRVIKVVPACAIMISCYEFGKAFFRKHNQERLLTSNT
ncbi:mitochondrial glutathione transporter SLC25A40-like [Salvelinus alpinus]|uniref:mitochondrial glutathione transporter SLC25A40-like n=2 Tax=Salvelinus TaxID=8033 RepID=UPI0039FBAED3